MITSFVGREQEKALLDRLWAGSKSQFLVLYGRRRVGKTRLLTEWAARHADRTILWVVDPDSPASHLRQFSQLVYGFAYPKMPVPEGFSFANWDQAWNQVTEIAQKDRLCVIIDEFTHLLQADQRVAGQLQRIWDQSLENANLLLVISGSHIGMMQRDVLSYQAPLYGRSTSHLHLQPLPFGKTREYFPTYNASDRVTIYALLGGIPHYWRLIDQEKTLSQNIQDLFLTPGGIMDGEARLLLQDYISDTHNYVAILRAIANGKNTPKLIEGFTGITNVHVSGYLKVLMESGYVTRFEPVTARNPTRVGRHYITDPYLRFYFRFLASRKSQFALSESSAAYEEFHRHMVDFIGTYTWEELCREWLLRASTRHVIQLDIDQVGAVWEQDMQVDVVGVNSMTRQLALGECKWSQNPIDSEPIRKLVSRTQAVVPDDREWTVMYFIFARAGLTVDGENQLALIDRARPSGKNWQCNGIRALTLVQVDNDLTTWS